MKNNSLMSNKSKTVLITGANGFIGKNLSLRLSELDRFNIIKFNREQDPSDLFFLLAKADFVIHLAGVNRAENDSDFLKYNLGFTNFLCQAAKEVFLKYGKRVKIIFASSEQAKLNNEYGKSKLAAEESFKNLVNEIGNSVTIFRLPGVFGKWCKPNYNSVVSTFCFNISRGLPIEIHDPEKELELLYIDDLINIFVSAIDDTKELYNFASVEPVYKISLRELASKLKEFNTSRSNLVVDFVGTGFLRALYSTFISYLPLNGFNYKIPLHKDSRGVFVEMVKTQNSGQFSFFIAHPGMKRGEHYHHTKTEKFLVIRGDALFRFKNIITEESVEIRVSGNIPEIVDTIPGWAHDITNIGKEDLIVMLWANEIFNVESPDTTHFKIIN